MKFSKVIGPIEGAENIIADAERYMTEIFSELSTGWEMNAMGSRLGGDPILMQLVSPMPHCADLTGWGFKQIEKDANRVRRKMNIGIRLDTADIVSLKKETDYKRQYPQIMRTAGTDGRMFYWAPDFILRKSKVGVRHLINHEGFHAQLMHPERRGSRIPALWNIAIDYKAQWNIFEDLRARKIRNIEDSFRELGEFITLKEYVQFVKDPYSPPRKMTAVGPTWQLRRMLADDYIEIEPAETFLVYGDPYLTKEMHQPEDLYQFLFNQAGRCPRCNKQFHYRKSEEYRELEVKVAEKKRANETRQ